MLRSRWLVLGALAFVAAFACGLLVGCGSIGSSATSTPNRPTPAQPAASCGCAATPVAANAPRLLVFTKTQAFRHASIPAAKAAVQSLACQRGWRTDFTEDSADFTSANLAHYAAVMFLLTTGNVLDDAQKSAFEGYIRSGGGFAGVHSASDTEYSWAWYDGLVGAHNNINNKHSAVTQGTIQVVDPTNISTSMLPARWTRTDEWYNFATNPRPFVHVLMTMDEATYKGGTMGADHPIAWYHDYDGGRAWYTALGHTVESYSEPLFLAHLAGGLTYAMGQSTTAPITPPVPPCATATGPAAMIAPSYCGGDLPDVALVEAAFPALTTQNRLLVR